MQAQDQGTVTNLIASLFWRLGATNIKECLLNMLAFLRDMMGQWLRQTREMNYLSFNELILLIGQTTFSIIDHILYMLWFKFILGLMFFELVSILCAIVPDYGNEYMTKENKNWTSFKNFAPKLNLNHNIYLTLLSIHLSVIMVYTHIRP